MRRSFLLMWAAVAVLACWRLDPARRPLTGDNQIYFFMAERAASGVPPHVSHVDSKHQLGVLATAVSIRAGRALGADDVAASRLVSIAFAAIAVAAAAALAARLAASPAAGHLAALTLLAGRGFADHAVVGSNPKLFLAAFVLLAHLAMARGAPANGAARRDVLAGVCAGAAFACWQPAVLVVAAVALEALVARGGSLRRAATVLLAACVPVLAYESYFALHGALGVQLSQSWLMPLGSVHEPSRLARSLDFVLGEGGRSAWPVRVGPLSLAVLAAWQLVRLLRSPGRALDEMRAHDGRVSFAAGAAAAVLFTMYDHQGIPDLFFPAPYFAVASGLLVVAVARGAGRLLQRPMMLPVSIGVAVVLLLQVQHDGRRRRVPAYDLGDQRRLAEVVRAERERSGGVWAYGAVHLLGLAHLDNHVPYGVFYDDVRSVLDVDGFVPARDGRLPGLIVQSRARFPQAAPYLAAEYLEQTPAEFRDQGIRVWRRRGSGGASGSDDDGTPGEGRPGGS